jgi:hypothetical protein
METYELYAMASVGLFTIGLAAVFLCRHFFKKLLRPKLLVREFFYY